MQVMTLLKTTASIDAYTSVNEKTNEYFSRTCLPRTLRLSATIYERYIFRTLHSIHFFLT